MITPNLGLFRIRKWMWSFFSVVLLTADLASAATFTVNVAPGGSLTYSPTNLTVNVGDTVIFSDPSNGHTVTGTGTDPFCGGGIAVGNNCQITFNSVGTFPYQCNVANHAALGMKGTITVQSAAAPSIAGTGGTLAYPIGGGPQTVDNAITVTDPGSTTLASATISISAGYSVGADSLNFTAANGITGSFSSGTGILTLSGTTTLANYQTAFRSVTFNTSSSSTTTRTISFVASDGTASSSAYTRNIAPQVTDTAPSITGSSGSANYTEGSAAVNVDGLVTVADPDSPNMFGGSVTIAINFVSGQDVLSFTQVGSVVGNYNASTGVLTITGTDSIANYNSFLRSVKYSNTSSNPNTNTRTIRFLVNDGQVGSQPFNRLMTVTPVNNPPVVSGNGGNFTYTAPGQPVTLDGTVAVSDVDSTTLASAAISIISGFQSGGDALGFANQNGITGSFDTNSGILTLTGTTTLTNYTLALRSVTFGNSATVPTSTQRIMTFVANDGSANNSTSVSYFRVVNMNVVLPPTIALTSPANNVTNNAPVSISLAANASANGSSTLTKVEFFDESTLVGTANGTPYAVTLTNVNGGTYVFTAKATDSAGLFATTPPVTNFVRGAVIAPLRLPDGTFQFGLNSLNTTKTNMIEFSTDLIAWTFLTNFVPSSSNIIFTDSNAVNQPLRYYRHSVLK